MPQPSHGLLVALCTHRSHSITVPALLIASRHKQLLNAPVVCAELPPPHAITALPPLGDPEFAALLLVLSGGALCALGDTLTASVKAAQDQGTLYFDPQGPQPSWRSQWPQLQPPPTRGSSVAVYKLALQEFAAASTLYIAAGHRQLGLSMPLVFVAQVASLVSASHIMVSFGAHGANALTAVSRRTCAQVRNKLAAEAAMALLLAIDPCNANVMQAISGVHELMHRYVHHRGGVSTRWLAHLTSNCTPARSHAAAAWAQAASVAQSASAQPGALPYLPRWAAACWDSQQACTRLRDPEVHYASALSPAAAASGLLTGTGDDTLVASCEWVARG